MYVCTYITCAFLGSPCLLTASKVTVFPQSLYVHHVTKVGCQ